MTQADWIAVDWGTSALRAWAMGPGGTVLDKAESPTMAWAGWNRRNSSRRSCA